tara:strand:- start:621 stop:1238 length:618 start_codon:yes stop_codon:yes gene_type:complete
LRLLGSFDDVPSLNVGIAELRDTLDSPLDSLFQADGHFIRYKINHESWNNDEMLKMGSVDLSRYPGIPPPFNPYVYEIQIYLQESDSIIFRREPSTLDSIDIKIADWYRGLKSKEYKKVRITLYWDENSNVQKLNSVVNESINGYLIFANETSLNRFNVPVCRLSKDNLDSLSMLLPFRLGTDFFGSEKFNKWDFIPHEFTNEPY